jgi:hypothetical protein
LSASTVSVEGGLRVEVGRDALGCDPEGVQEATDRLGRVHHRCRGVEPTEVDVELPVGEPVADPVGPVHRQGGLAHPGGAGNRGNHHRRWLVGRVVQEVVEAGELLGAAGETGHVGG